MGTLGKPVLEVSQLSYRYPDGTLAVRNVSFQVETGERVAIIGPNGAGKSTLLLQMNRTLQGEGTVRVDGELLNSHTLYAIRKKVGMVFQESNDQLFMPTVFEDVGFGTMNLGGSETEIRERVEKALQAVGMSGSEPLAPHHLSVGQKKKIALATVLATDPEILVIDEPTASLDPRGRRSLMDLLKRLPQTQLIATHDLDLVFEICHRALLMDGGEIIYQARVPDIFKEETLFLAHGLEQPARRTAQINIRSK
jgi:cobalt/nickel transport system ATP-binding protein